MDDEQDLRGRLALREATRLRQSGLAAGVGVLGWICAAQFAPIWGAVAYLFMTAGAALFVIDAGRSWDRVVVLRRTSGAGRRPVVDGMALAGVAVSGLAVMCGLMTVFAS